MDAERTPASPQSPLYLLKGLAPSSLLSYPCHPPCPTCSLSMPAQIGRKRSSRTELPASSCSACKTPFSCSHRQRPLSTGTTSAWRFTPTVPLFATTALEAYSRVTDCSASSTSRYHRLLLARPYQPVFLFLFLSAAYFLLG